MTIDDDLASARDALNAGDDATALRHLLVAWRATPAAELADAIELVGARAAAALHAPGGVTEEDREAAWHAAARAGDPVMRHRLLATVTDVPDDRQMLVRAEQLVSARDPRVATMLLALATEVRASLVHHVPDYWRPLYRMLETCGDPRVRARFLAIDYGPRLRHVSSSRQTAFHARIAKVNARIAAAYPEAPPALPSDHAALVADILELARRPLASAAHDAETEAALLAAVRAAPADDGPRAIYADWLQERGDPHGELIALQLATQGIPRWKLDGEMARIDTLLEQHSKQWIGPIISCLQTHEFERGFLAKCDIAWAERDVARLPTPPDPAWATVRAIRGGLPATDEHPMPGLVYAVGLDTPALQRLAALAHPPPLVTLGWTCPPGGNAIEAVVAYERVLPRLPTLRGLEIGAQRIPDTGPEGFPWKWRDTQLRRLRVATAMRQLPAWAAAAAASQLETFEIRSGWNVTLERAGSIAIDARWSASDFDERFDAVCDALDRLPPELLRIITFNVSSKDLWTLERRRRMARALDRHPGLAEIDIYGFTRPKR
ncbi:MAG: TIGR02996 domain-containing protein [Deltaproteobacteria bacterium]|nr:TIGR02996 domain-containing protein [Deltaproteobacteria bacterium]